MLLECKDDEDEPGRSEGSGAAAAPGRGVSGTSVVTLSAEISIAEGASLSAGCRAGSGVTERTDPPSPLLATPLSTSLPLPCRSSLYPISPCLDGRGPACGLEAVRVEVELLDAIDAIAGDRKKN